VRLGVQNWDGGEDMKITIEIDDKAIKFESEKNVTHDVFWTEETESAWTKVNKPVEEKKEETCKWIFTQGLDRYYCGDHELSYGFPKEQKLNFCFCPKCGKRIEVVQ
jgi:hypothetical protein